MGKGTGKENGSGSEVGNGAENGERTGDSGIARIGVAFRNSGDSKPKGGGESSEFFENLVWMTSAEAATYLRKSYGALRVMVCRGYIRPRMFHRRWYFKRTELDRLIENS